MKWYDNKLFENNYKHKKKLQLSHYNKINKLIRRNKEQKDKAKNKITDIEALEIITVDL